MRIIEGDKLYIAKFSANKRMQENVLAYAPYSIFGHDFANRFAEKLPVGTYVRITQIMGIGEKPTVETF